MNILYILFLICLVTCRDLTISGRLTCYSDYDRAANLRVVIVSKGSPDPLILNEQLTDLDGHYSIKLINIKSGAQNLMFGAYHDCENDQGEIDNCLRHFKYQVPPAITVGPKANLGTLTLVPSSLDGEERFCSNK